MRKETAWAGKTLFLRILAVSASAYTTVLDYTRVQTLVTHCRGYEGHRDSHARKEGTTLDGIGYLGGT